MQLGRVTRKLCDLPVMLLCILKNNAQEDTNEQ
jgi:hypothetical protein